MRAMTLTVKFLGVINLEFLILNSVQNKEEEPRVIRD